MREVIVYGLVGGMDDALLNRIIPKLINSGLLIPLRLNVSDEERLKAIESLAHKATKKKGK